MNNSKVEIINIGFILFSAIVAVFIPLELFLFSYAVLGPLHYLTEINWLNTKDFFSTTRNVPALLLIVSFVLACLYVAAQGYGIVYISEHISINQLFTALFLLSFLISVIFSSQKFSPKLSVITPFLFAVSLLISNFNFVFICFGLLLPTLVHVYFFTGIFMYAGARKNSSKLGYLSLFVFVLSSILVLLNWEIYYYPNLDLYQKFRSINFDYLLNTLSFSDLNTEANIFSNLQLRVLRFIAFAYTYHYLNWFSKTKIINWHITSRPKLFAIIFIWFLSVLLYFINYELGFLILFFFSTLHVLLELPLNIITIKNAFKNKF